MIAPQIEHRQRQYNPTYGNRQYSKSFIDHTKNTVVNSLSDIDVNATYFEGWLIINDISDIHEISITHTTAHIDKQYHSKLRDEVGKVIQRIHALNLYPDRIHALRTLPNHPLKLTQQLFAVINDAFPESDDNLTIIQPNITNNRRPNKSQGIQALYPSYPSIPSLLSIPDKKITKTQQKKKEETKQKNQRAKLKQKPPPTLPAAKWYPQEQRRRILYQQHRVEVMKQKESVLKVPETIEYTKIDANTNNATQSNDNVKYKSKKDIKPSKRMIESNLYEQRQPITQTLTSKYDVISDSDDDF